MPTAGEWLNREIAEQSNRPSVPLVAELKPSADQEPVAERHSVLRWLPMSISHSMEDATAPTSRAASFAKWGEELDASMRKTLAENMRKYPVLPAPVKATASSGQSSSLEEIEDQMTASAHQREAMGQVVHWPKGKPKK